MNRNVEILDCTLRDGGYLIDWNFGEFTINSVLSNLVKSKVDYIELGFFKNLPYVGNRTFFSKISDVEKLISDTQKYTLMVNFGEYCLNNFEKCNNKNIKIRVAFKKQDQKNALDYIYKLKNLGWDVFANPMSTNTYSTKELRNLIAEINIIKPFGLSMVDTLGNMYEKDVIKLFKLFDNNLDTNIVICFHSHNSMQLSFSNAKTLLKLKTARNIIIDSCLYGMGRGAGNLCTELILNYLNDTEKKYNISPILKCIEDAIKPIYEKNPWGYSTPFYIAAIHGCHPNYADYLVKNNFSDKFIDKILSQIPNDKKIVFDKDLIITLAKK